MPDRTGIVIGIDVGGLRKGFHAVALRDGEYLEKFLAFDATSIFRWCQQIGAQAIGIDAPCRWSSSGRARIAERELAADGIFAFATPCQEVAIHKPFYRWMLNGAKLFHIIEQHYPLFNGRNSASGKVCFETFPHAIACILAGQIVSAKQKGIVRRNLLHGAGITISDLTNIDLVDAALCALAAHYLVADNFKNYGDTREGFIVVPARRGKERSAFHAGRVTNDYS